MKTIRTLSTAVALILMLSLPDDGWRYTDLGRVTAASPAPGICNCHEAR